MPSEPLLRVSLAEHHSTLMVTVVGELDLASAAELRDAVAEVQWRNYGRVVFDLHEVGFIDSSGLGALIAIRNDHPETDIAIVTGADGLVIKVLRLTAMEELFPIYPSAEAALA